MAAVIARILPPASASQVASIDSIVTVTLFAGFGWLLSLVVVILDQITPGDWF